MRKRLIGISILLLTMAACDKKGDFQPNTAIIKISARSFSVKANAVFTVKINDQVVADSFINGSRREWVIAKHTDAPQHFVLQVPGTKQVLIDTFINISGNKATMRILEFDNTENSKPILIVGEANEGSGPGKIGKFAFYYNDSNIPQEIKLELYKIRLDENWNIVTDTLTTFDHLVKNKLSEFKDLDLTNYDPSNSLYVFQLRDFNTNEFLGGGKYDFDNLLGPEISFIQDFLSGIHQNTIQNISTYGRAPNYGYRATTLTFY